jgi:hypothetical protein
MSSRPYIGVTGFMKQEEVKHALDTFSLCRLSTDVGERSLMVGVLTSAKTLAGEGNKYPHRYPRVETIRDIFVKHPLAFNCIHHHTDNHDALEEQLEGLVSIAGPNLHGFQLNVTWPDVEMLREFRARHALKLILQVGAKAMARAIESDQDLPTYYKAKKISQVVRQYEDCASYVLLDPSGGKGEPFNVELAVDFLKCMKISTLMVGEAGGLSASTLGALKPSLQVDPNLSWDAEGRLRDKDDNLDLHAVCHYILESVNLLENPFSWGT